MKGILINSKNETITEVEVGDYKTISGFIECEFLDVVSIGENEDVYVDDEGLLNLDRDSKFFMINTYPQPLAGNGLILGFDFETGNSLDTKLTVDEVKKMVRFHTLNEVQLMGR